MAFFTTGPTLLPDIGTISYNGCDFGPLFSSEVSSNPVKDDAKRTVKFVEHAISVDGYVTVPLGGSDIAGSMATLYRLLTSQGGALLYRGRGLDLTVNVKGAGAQFDPQSDVAWGPVPELVEFQPMGGGRSAKVKWKVTTRVLPPAVAATQGSLNLLQLNYDTSVSYGEDGYSSISVKGVIEVPMTYLTQGVRTVQTTADKFRVDIEKRILSGIDLGRFRIVKRDFSVSRDKRTLDFDVQAEEKAYMDLPPDCTVARGTYNVRQAKSGPGLVLWMCTLRATYTVRADRPRKTAWWAFLALLRLRMEQSKTTEIPVDNEKPKPPGVFDIAKGIVLGATVPNSVKESIEAMKRNKDLGKRAWLIDFSFDEGLYQDSKTVSFSATWRMTSMFHSVLIASGIWKKVPEGGRNAADNKWAIAMKDVMGSRSWLPNQLDPNLDIVVDFGSTSL